MVVLICGFAQNITSNIICKIYYNMGKVKKAIKIWHLMKKN